MFYSILLVCLSMVLAMDPITQDLVTPLKEQGESCGYEACQEPREGMLNVHIIPHSHAELGYTRSFHKHYTGHDEFYPKSNINMKRVFDATIGELWSDRKRTFTLSSSELPYFFHWWANRDGTVHRMVYQLLRQGRLSVVGGGWGMSDEASASYQPLIDQFTYAMRKLNASFLDCARPLVAWQADNFGHSREVTSLLAQLGFDGLFINPISFDDELARMSRKGLEFLWRGSDDLGRETDLFTHKLFDGYWSPPGFCFGSMCEDPILVTSNSIFRNVDERVRIFLESVINRQAPHYGTKHLLIVMGQRFGYFDAPLWFANVDKLIDFGNVKGASSSYKVYIHYSTPACYLKAVHESKPVLETKQDDFFPFAYNQFTYATGMYTSRPTIKYMMKEGNIYLQISKQLQVLAQLGNNDKLFEEFNWIMGVLQDHNVLSGAMRLYVKNYYSNKIYNAVQASTVLMRKAFNKFRGSKTKVYYRCSFNVSSCKALGSPLSEIVIYNPLGWPVSMPVRLPVRKDKYIVYNHKGEIVKSSMMKIPSPVLSIPERKTSANQEIVFIARDLPPLGLRAYLIQRKSKRDKRELIKKLKRTKQGKYYIRQAKLSSLDNDTFFASDEDYEFYEDTTTEGDNLQGNVPKDKSNNDKGSILTPKPRSSSIRNAEDVDDIVVTENVTDIYETATENDAITMNGKINSLKDYDITERTMDGPTRTTTFGTESTTVGVDTATSLPIMLDEEGLNASEKIEKTGEVDNDKEDTATEVIDTDKEDAMIKNSSTAEATTTDKYNSEDQFIENKYIRISLDNSTNRVASVVLCNGVNTSLDIQFYYYKSDDPEKMGKVSEKKPPGAYIFRAMDINPTPIMDYIDTKVYKSDVVSEIHCKYSNYASFALKLYEDNPVIEVDWTAGPISVNDGVGKDVFIRYTTDLENEGVFYTDANGRQTIKRLRHTRATYNPVNFDSIAGNIYPVTSRIYIEDLKKNIRLSIFNDRSQGGTSLYDGQIDLIVHRRIITDDSGIQSYLNETRDRQGIIVRGKHYLYLTKADYKPNKVFEKKFAKEIELMPQIFANREKVPKRKEWLKYNNEVYALKNKLPIGVHLLTLEKWSDDTILIRLENYLEKVDVFKNGVKKVFLKELFINIEVVTVKETTLGANVWLESWTPLQWNTSKPFIKRFNDYYGSADKVEYSEDVELKPFEDVVLDEGITLTPQQIRTFVAWFRYRKPEHVEG